MPILKYFFVKESEYNGVEYGKYVVYPDSETDEHIHFVAVEHRGAFFPFAVNETDDEGGKIWYADSILFEDAFRSLLPKNHNKSDIHTLDVKAESHICYMRLSDPEPNNEYIVWDDRDYTSPPKQLDIVFSRGVFRPSEYKEHGIFVSEQTFEQCLQPCIDTGLPMKKVTV